MQRFDIVYMKSKSAINPFVIPFASEMISSQGRHMSSQETLSFVQYIARANINENIIIPH